MRHNDNARTSATDRPFSTRTAHPKESHSRSARPAAPSVTAAQAVTTVRVLCRSLAVPAAAAATEAMFRPARTAAAHSLTPSTLSLPRASDARGERCPHVHTRILPNHTHTHSYPVPTALTRRRAYTAAPMRRDSSQTLDLRDARRTHG